MKIKTLIAYFIFTCAISSCIQDEALNSEAAIDVCSGDDVQLANIDADSKVINVYVNLKSASNLNEIGRASCRERV